MSETKELIGQVVGNYELVEFLGGGGMSEGVYRARHIKLESNVAIKIMDIGAGTTLDRRKRIIEEPRRTASLSHPNIVRVMDVIEEGPRLYMVMDYIDGKTLLQIIGEKERTAQVGAEGKKTQTGPGSHVSKEFAASIIRQIGRALDYAHNHGIIHRDVKPSNILVTQDGHAILSDFGIAKALEATELSITREGVGVGTPPYMSPEQVRGDELTPACDEYSLAIVAYQMLTGQVPFEGESPMIIAHKHLVEPPPSARKINPAISKQTEDILMKALAKEPKDRFGRAGTFSIKLANSLVGSSSELEMPPISFWMRFQETRGWGVIHRIWRGIKAAVQWVIETVFRSLVYILIGLALFLVLLAFGGTFLASSYLDKQIAGYNWGLNQLAMTGKFTINQQDLESGLNQTAQLYLPSSVEKLTIQLSPPSNIRLGGTVLGSNIDIWGTVTVVSGHPVFKITSMNGKQPLIFLDILAGGVNRGFASAFQQSQAYISQFKMNSASIDISLSAPRVSATEQSVTPLPSGVAFKDDFTNLDSGWPRHYVVEAARLGYENGHYRIDLLQPNFLVIQDLPKTFSEFTIDIDITLASGPPATQYGLVVDEQDNLNYLGILLTGDGFCEVYTEVRGQTTTLKDWTHVDSMNPSGPVHLKVILKSGTANVNVAGTIVTTVEIPSGLGQAGKIGFLAQSSPQGEATIYYDHLAVSTGK